MDVVMLSRLQFAAATMFHFLFVPVVLAYQIYAYKLFSVKVTEDDPAHKIMY